MKKEEVQHMYDVSPIDVIPQEPRIRLLAEEAYAASRLGTWCLDPKGRLHASTSPNEQDFFTFFQISGCLDLACSRAGGFDRPALLSDSIGMVWIAEHMYRDGAPMLLFLLGPVFFSETSVKSIETSLAGQNLSLPVRLKMIRLIDKVPVMPQIVFRQYGIMFHHALTKKTIAPSDFLVLNPAEVPQNTVPETLKENQSDIERDLAHENAILKAIEDGNPEILKVVDSSKSYGEMDTGINSEPLRKGKNTAIIFCALCCRAAIAGGLPPHTAKQTENTYLNRIESCRLYTELIDVHTNMLKDFAQQVRKSKDYGHISPEIRDCCSFIRSNILNDITLASVAAHSGYTEYYLSRKFQREVGIRINDFIKEAKIDYAKMLLATSDKTIQEISDTLNFSTRNYFSKVFHDITGKTPAEYRSRT